VAGSTRKGGTNGLLWASNYMIQISCKDVLYSADTAFA
jgi:hypothetical protein